MLLERRGPADEARINRLFAVYSAELEALQPDLVAAGALQRRKAVQSLRIYGPLARKELERAVGDSDRQVRLDAVRGLVEVEGLTVGAAAERRLESKDAAVARPFLEAMVREKGCAPFFLGVARDTQQPAALRGDALAYLADCDEGTRERAAKVVPFLTDPEALVRAGAVRSLG
ncbi:hypothetical protein ACLESO_59385, partial [Pyxidicoccus sp. 3LG]